MDTQEILLQAKSLVQTGEQTQSRMLLLKLLEQDAENITALMMLGGSYFSEGKYSEAEMIFERLVLLEAGSGQASIALFNTLWKLQRHEEALEEIKRFTTHADPNTEYQTIAQYQEIVKSIEEV